MASPYGSQPASHPVNYEALAKYYTEVIYVYKCIRKLASSISSLPLQFFNRKTDEEVEKGPLPDLFKFVNPWESPSRMMEQIVGYLLISGNAYLAYEPPGARAPQEIFILRSDRVKIKPDPVNYIASYHYTPPGSTQDLIYLPSEVVHFKEFHPLNDYYGLSRITVASMSIESEKYAVDWNRRFFLNSARPDGYIKTEQELTPEQAEEIRLSWENTHRGYWNSQRVGVLGQGADYKSMGIAQKDMDFIGLRKLSKNDICNIFGVPLPMVEMTESTFNNLEGARKEYWVGVQELSSTISDQLSESDLFVRSGLYCKFDFSGVEALKEDEDRKSQIVLRLAQGKIMSVNEIREEFYNSEPVPWGDAPWMSMTDIQYGEERPELAPPPKEEPKEEEEEKPDTASKSVRDLYDQVNWFILAKAWERHEGRFLREVKRLFAEQEREILGRIKQKSLNGIHGHSGIVEKDVDMNLVFDFDKWVAQFYKTGYPLEAMSVGEGINNAKQYIKDNFGAESLLTLESDTVARFLQSKTMKFAKDVNQTTREAIRHAIDEALGEGETIDEIARRVKGVFEKASRFRAQMIARTETIGASNQGTLMAYKDAGIPLKKKWFAAMDERTRDSHKRAHKLAAVDLDKPFVFEGEKGTVRMNAPGDPNGPPEEVIQCRCTLIPVQER